MSHGADEPVPEQVRDLILRYIDTVAQLEALLFLRERPGESWEASAVARRLYAPEPEVSAALGRLAAEGFINGAGGLYRYEAPNAFETRIDQLAATYRRHLIPVTNLIHSKPRNIRAFSDAFRFRKDN